MGDLRLDVDLSISGSLDICLDVYDPVVADSVLIDSRVVDVTLTTNYVPMPSDAECLPMVVSLDVGDISGLFNFNVTHDCYTKLNLYSDPSVILDVDCSFHWPEDKYPFYEGDYFIDPRKVNQVLPTKEKSMSDDLQVNSIYFSKVINESGGNTVVIGKE